MNLTTEVQVAIDYIRSGNPPPNPRSAGVILANAVEQLAAETERLRNLIATLFTYEPAWASREGVDEIGHPLNIYGETRKQLIEILQVHNERN